MELAPALGPPAALVLGSLHPTRSIPDAKDEGNQVGFLPWGGNVVFSP